MANILDRRLLDFYENDRPTAQTLRGIIRKKQRFPKDEFSKLKEAFPCIIAGIRDYAEYVPLEPELFDLLIIDEASQVSIAQAFPALLRAKKVAPDLTGLSTAARDTLAARERGEKGEAAFMTTFSFLELPQRGFYI